MNAKRVAAAEGVILAAQKTRKTAAGVAIALESACLLQSPESAADHRAEVQAERDAQIVAWLLKKSYEYGTSNRENRAKAEAVWRMADKLSRGAVRPDGECAELAEQAADEVDRLRAEVDRVQRLYTFDTAELKKKVAELEAAAYGDAGVRLLDPVGQIRHLHAALSAQMSRADTLDRLCRERDARVAELLAERHTTNGALSDAAEQLRVNRDRIAELEAHLGRDAEQRHLMDPLDHALEALAPRTVELGPHLFEAEHMGESDAKRRLPRCKECKNSATDPAHAADDRPEVRHLRALLNARRPAEDPHESPLHHDYAVSRDFPTTAETSGSAL